MKKCDQLEMNQEKTDSMMMIEEYIMINQIYSKGCLMVVESMQGLFGNEMFDDLACQ